MGMLRSVRLAVEEQAEVNDSEMQRTEMTEPCK